MELKGSQTERNLVRAFVGESVARNRYTYFSSQARNDGYIQISQVFEETAGQEKEHAKRFFKSLQGGEVKIECAFPAGIVGTTLENLSAAAHGENEEWSALYPSFAAKAREEGFKTVGVIFDMVSVAEKQHERRFRGLLENLQNGRVFKRDQPVRWRCLNCGYVHEGPGAPAACPACAHPQAYFEVLIENW
jgi:rubrerythrin